MFDRIAVPGPRKIRQTTRLSAFHPAHRGLNLGHDLPRASYGGAYHHAPSFPDTPIYDSLVAERGTPQIAPIRVPAAYDTGISSLPALPSALPALPAAPAPQPAAPSYGGYGYPQQAPAPQYAPPQYTPAPHASAPYVPQQATAPRGYPGPSRCAPSRRWPPGTRRCAPSRRVPPRCPRHRTTIPTSGRTRAVTDGTAPRTGRPGPAPAPPRPGPLAGWGHAE